MRRGQQIVRGGDGVDIAGQMEIELLHRNDLAVASAGRAALDAKGRALAGLANAGENSCREVRSQRLAQPHRGGGLALAERRGRDRGDDNVVAVGSVLETLAMDRCTLAFVLPYSSSSSGRMPARAAMWSMGMGWRPAQSRCRKGSLGQ